MVRTIARQRHHRSSASATEVETLFTIQELMATLGIHSRQTIYHLMERDELPHLYIGNCLRFLPSHIQTWIVQHEQQRRPVYAATRTHHLSESKKAC